ncbi:MAG: T9SS type A sorting domain-containing protein [Ferruginibacter sp.]
MKKHLLVAVSFILFFTASAQWQNQNAALMNNALGFYEMSIVDHKTAWAVCYDGINGLFSNRLVLDFTRTVNAGNTWISGKMGNDSSLQFSNISAVSKKEAWVAMHKLNGITGGGLYHTTDGGVTWSQSNAGLIFDANSFPNFVHFKNKNKGVAMGDPNGGSFEVYTTNNGGDSWNRITPAHLPAPLANEYGFISGYYAVDNTIWFGTLSGRMYKSTNFGKDWTVNTVDPAGNGVYEIAFNDDKLHGVTHVRTATQTLLYSTTDGGVTWTNLGIPPYWKSSRITAVPGTNALVSTSVIPTNQGSAISYDNGTTWTELENTAPKAVARFLDEHTGWAGGFYFLGPPFSGGIYKSEINFQTSQCHNSKVNPNAITSTGPSVIEQNTKADFVKIYPTPANDVINILLPDSPVITTYVISILTMEGRSIETRKLQSSKLYQVNVSKLTTGSYIIRFTNNGQTVNKVFTIAR